MRLSPLLCLLALMVGCSSLQLDPPSVTLTDIRLTDIRLLETTMEVDVRIGNPNRVPFAIAGTVHDLSLNGTKVGQAISDQTLIIDPLSSQVITMTMHIDSLSMVSKLKSIIKDKAFDYRIDSKLYLGDTKLFDTISTSHEGRFDANDPE